MKTSLPNGLPKEVELSFLPPHIIERARALAKPVEVSDEPLLVETIVDALRKDKDASYRDILNGLHGVSHMVPLLCPILHALLRGMGTPLAFGRTTTWTTRDTSTSLCGQRRKRVQHSPPFPNH